MYVYIYIYTYIYIYIYVLNLTHQAPIDRHAASLIASCPGYQYNCSHSMLYYTIV